MPVLVRENPKQAGRDSFEFSESRRERHYSIMGANTYGEMLRAVAREAPLSMDGLPLKGIDWEEKGGGVWEAIVDYNAEQDNGETNSEFLEFDTTGGTQHITHSRQTIQRYGRNVNYQNGIGVTDTDIEGVDIVVPVFSFTKRRIIPTSWMSDAYITTLYTMTGKTNNSTFWIFEAGELLFMGAQGGKKGYEQWEVSFKFAASPNVTGLSVGDISGIAKKGWEYLWVRYKESEDNGRLVKTPETVIIERVYNAGNFNSLGVDG